MDEELNAIAAELQREIETEMAAVRRSLAEAERLSGIAGRLGKAQIVDDLAARTSTLRQRLTELQQAESELGRADALSGEPAATEVAPPAVDQRTVSAPEGASQVGKRVALRAEPGESHPSAQPENGLSATILTPSDGVLEPAAWVPRPRGELEAVRDGVEDEVSSLADGDLASLALFKMHAALLRGASVERTRHPGEQAAWRATLGLLRDRQKAAWADHYCIPIAPKVELAPCDWQRLAELFHGLSLAQQALDFAQSARGEQPKQVLSPIIEASGAAVSLLNRWLRQHLPGQHDDQQLGLYRWVCDYGAQEGLFIRSLQPETSDTELESLAGDLPARFQNLEATVQKKRRQAGALARLSGILSDPEFGGAEGDADALCDLALACMEEGIPVTHKRLRDVLLEYEWMLEDDPRVLRLHTAVAKERERLAGKSPTAIDEAPVERVDSFPEGLREMLSRVLTVTAGRKGVIVGGRCREDARRVLESALQFSDLAWPDREPSDSFERSANDISRADVVFLTRFNRRKSKEAFRICHEQGKRLVCLPKGYGLHEVISRAFHACAPRSS